MVVGGEEPGGVGWRGTGRGTASVVRLGCTGRASGLRLSVWSFAASIFIRLYLFGEVHVGSRRRAEERMITETRDNPAAQAGCLLRWFTILSADLQYERVSWVNAMVRYCQL